MYTADWLEKCVRQNTWKYMDTQVLIDYGFICQTGTILEKHWNILFDVYRYLFIHKNISSLELHDRYVQNQLDEFIHHQFQHVVNVPYCYVEFKRLGLIIGQTKY